MVKKMLVCISCVLMCLFSSCVREEDPQKLIEKTGGLFEQTIGGISIKVTPISLKCGEEITIEVSSKSGIGIPVVVSSESLDINEERTAPFTLKKMLNVPGRHDLGFSIQTGEVSISTTSTFIEVWE